MSMQIDATHQRSALETALWRNRLLLSLVLMHVMAGATVSVFVGASFWSGTVPILLNILKTLSVIGALCFLIWRFAYAAMVVKPKSPIKWLAADLKATIRNPDMVLDGVICFVATGVMAAAFTALKDMIPMLSPYSWDLRFAELDRVLHGGTDVWALLWPVFGTPVLTTALNAAYHIWFPLLYVMVFLACFDRRDPNRGMVFLTAFALTWIIGGNLLATVYASVGPVYFEAFGFGDTFVPQMEALERMNQIMPVWALDIQKMLLENHLANGPVRGISAMPSMHVATSVIMALYGFSYARWLGWCLTGFAAVILIGSVHLAWHYAVDGYASIALALVVWSVAKALTRHFGPDRTQDHSASRAT